MSGKIIKLSQHEINGYAKRKYPIEVLEIIKTIGCEKNFLADIEEIVVEQQYSEKGIKIDKKFVKEAIANTLETVKTVDKEVVKKGLLEHPEIFKYVTDNEYRTGL